MSRNYFEGWYYKHQACGRTLAVIPGRARDGAFVQVVMDGQSYNASYPHTQFAFEGASLHVGNNVFMPDGIHLDMQNGDLSLRGELRYKNLTPIRGDIMGPFRFFPMECRHGVISMRHDVTGAVELNGDAIDFAGGIGYIETDRGRSFPKSYAWIHANDFEHGCSVMVSVAEIPWMGMHFQGCICVIFLGGREYRLATYKGVKILCCEPHVVSLRQGRYRLDIRIHEKEGCGLRAPHRGAMSRVINETASCPAHFKFSVGNTVLFEGKSEHASCEYVP